MNKFLRNSLSGARSLFSSSSSSPNNIGNIDQNGMGSMSLVGDDNTDSSCGSSSSGNDVLAVYGTPSTTATATPGVVASALWALARTPVLMQAVELEESKHGGGKQLSRVLRQLGRDENLRDGTKLREAFTDAEAFLAADGNMMDFERKEPLVAIAAILGLSSNAEAVMKRATESTYYVNENCSQCGCPGVGGRRQTELELRCLKGSPQLTADYRAWSMPKVYCAICKRKNLLPEWGMDIAPECLVATWPVLSQAEAKAGDFLRIQRNGESSLNPFTFKLSAMITFTDHHMCMFRSGNNFYAAKGQNVKEVSYHDWNKAKPLMALYMHNGSGDSPPASPRAELTSGVKHGHGEAARTGGVFSSSPPSARKRRRPQTGGVGNSPHREGGQERHSGGWRERLPEFGWEQSFTSRGGPSDCTRSGSSGHMSNALEVIEVNDDDDDDGDVVTKTSTLRSPADGSKGDVVSPGARSEGNVDLQRRKRNDREGDGEGKIGRGLDLMGHRVGNTAGACDRDRASVMPAVRGRTASKYSKSGRHDEDRGRGRSPSADGVRTTSISGNAGCYISVPGAAFVRCFTEKSQRSNAGGANGEEESGAPTHSSLKGTAGSECGRGTSLPKDDMDVDEDSSDTGSGREAADDGTEHQRSPPEKKAEPLWTARMLPRDRDKYRERAKRNDTRNIRGNDGSRNQSRLSSSSSSSEKSETMRQSRRLEGSHEKYLSQNVNVMTISDSESDADDDVQLVGNEARGKGAAPPDLSGRPVGGQSERRPSAGAVAEGTSIRDKDDITGGWMKAAAAAATAAVATAECTAASKPATFKTTSLLAQPPTDSKILNSTARGLHDSVHGGEGDEIAVVQHGRSRVDRWSETGRTASSLSAQRSPSPESSTPREGRSVPDEEDFEPRMSKAPGAAAPNTDRTLRDSLSPTSSGKLAPDGGGPSKIRASGVTRERDTSTAPREALAIQLEQYKCRHKKRFDDKGTRDRGDSTGSGDNGRRGSSSKGHSLLGTDGRRTRISPAWASSKSTPVSSSSSSSITSRAAARADDAVVSKPVESCVTPCDGECSDNEEAEWKPESASSSSRKTTKSQEGWDPTTAARRPATRGSSGGKDGGSDGPGGVVDRNHAAGVMEDLTGFDAYQEDDEDESVRGGGRLSSSREGANSGSKGGGGGGEGIDGGADSREIAVVRGISLKQDHFDRILLSDGWLTSQIVDIRVKQLQEKHPENLYFDSSFFGFLCPRTEKGGAFVVDYARVQGWTKRSRLPPGKASLFDMTKLFIPINQGNRHWVLVVVDLDGGDARQGGRGGGGVNSAGRDDDGSVVVGGSRDSENNEQANGKPVSFYDSLEMDGTKYVEAVQEYLISELSSRDKTRPGLFVTRPRPPKDAPVQRNTSDCGILMLHTMEVLSAGSVDDLKRLSQKEISRLREDLLVSIRS